MQYNFTSNSEYETRLIAQQVSEQLRDKITLLIGELGAGKTVFVKGLSKAFGISEDDITSPTFVIIQPYGDLIHVDLYRLENDSVRDIVLEITEYLSENKTVVVEWGEKIERFFPDAVKVFIKKKENDKREIIVSSIRR